MMNDTANLELWGEIIKDILNPTSLLRQTLLTSPLPYNPSLVLNKPIQKPKSFLIDDILRKDKELDFDLLAEYKQRNLQKTCRGSHSLAESIEAEFNRRSLRKERTVFTKSQLSQLKARFSFQRYLSSEERAGLALNLSLTEEQVIFLISTLL